MSIKELPDDKPDSTLKLLTLLNVAAARPQNLKRKREPERDWVSLARKARAAQIRPSSHPASPAMPAVEEKADGQDSKETSNGEFLRFGPLN
jgi:hypothetical protein